MEMSHPLHVGCTFQVRSLTQDSTLSSVMEGPLRKCYNTFVYELLKKREGDRKSSPPAPLPTTHVFKCRNFSCTTNAMELRIML